MPYRLAIPHRTKVIIPQKLHLSRNLRKFPKINIKTQAKGAFTLGENASALFKKAYFMLAS